MPFTVPEGLHSPNCAVPDSIPLHEFILNSEPNSRANGNSPRIPFTCGLTGRGYNIVNIQDRVRCLATSLAAELGWSPNDGAALDKVAAIYSLNSIDAMTVSWAVHRLSGVSAPISASYTADELSHQLRQIRCKALFTCQPLLGVALKAAASVGIAREHIYLLDVPVSCKPDSDVSVGVRTVDQLIEIAKELEPLQALQWKKGQGITQPAFLCCSSGTSGMPKNIVLSHQNAIAAVLSSVIFLDAHPEPGPEVCLGVLPQSHILALLNLCHVSAYRGDTVILLPGFDLHHVLRCIDRYLITRLFVVPAMIVALVNASKLLAPFRLESVKSVIVGAAPCSESCLDRLQSLKPTWKMRQGYGLTETAGAVACTPATDIWHGSCGTIGPGIEALLVDEAGKEIQAYDCPGQLLLKSPANMIGYLNDDEATREAYTDDGWLRTGDMAVMRQSQSGIPHLFIVDRIKDLIKVNGMQVAPAELESILMAHPAVAEVAVVPVSDESSGELPKAFVVRSPGYANAQAGDLEDEIVAHASQHLATYKQLRGGVEFIDVLPKNANGKVMRKVLMEKARETKKLADQKVTRSSIQVYDFED